MQSRYIKHDKLFEYPTKAIPECQYTNNHAYTNKDDDYVLFAGKINDHTDTRCVIHGKLKGIDIICLQIVLSYGLPITDSQYRKAIQHLLIHEPMLKLDTLTDLLHADPDWIKKVLQIDGSINMNNVCVTNAFTLTKVGMIGDELMRARAQIMHPSEFVPLCNEKMKEAKKKS